MNCKTVSRLAVLIGAPGHTNNYLRGVPVDIDNLKNFLMSPNGGRFHPHEVISLPKAKISDVASIIETAYVDYLFVYFSGHGYTESFSNKRMLCLQDANIEDLLLLNRSPRQLVIADACRNYTAPGISGVPEFGEEPEHFDGESEIRNLFDESILRSPAGRIIVHGTQRGHYSSDSSFGGFFTKALLHVGTNIRADQHYTKASISGVLQHVPSVLQRKENYQVPEMTYTSGNLQVLFAIGVPKPSYRTIAPRQIMQQGSNANWAQIGFGLLLLAALGYSFKR